MVWLVVVVLLLQMVLLLLVVLEDARCGDKVGANKGRQVHLCEIVELQAVVLVNGVWKARAEKTKTQTVNSWKGNRRRVMVVMVGSRYDSSVSSTRRLLKATAVKH